MKADIKARWMEALRSGQYGQAKGYLRHGDGYCCLGVLCDLAAKDGVGHWDDSGTFITSSEYGEEHHSLYEVPPVVERWAGLTSPNPQLGADTAVYWNDDQGASFERIAGLIGMHL